MKRTTTATILATVLLAGPVRADPRWHSVMVTQGDVGIETYVQGSGPAIVMLPSAGRDGGTDFDEVAASLQDAGYTVLRPQPRGAAGSVGPMQGVSLHQFGDDVALVIDRLGGGRAVIVGHAFGHFVARMTAVDHPGEVRGIVLAAAAAASYPPDVGAAPGIAGNVSLPDDTRLAALRLAFFAPGHDPHDWLNGWHPATLRMQADSREKAGVKQSDWWSGGQAPFLELIPSADPFKPRDKWGEMRAAYGDRVQTVVIDDASHALFPEQPRAVAEAIVAWVRTLPP